jgi:hypothetical protein
MKKHNSKTRSIFLIIGTLLAVVYLQPVVFVCSFILAMSSPSHADAGMYSYWRDGWLTSMRCCPTVTVTCVLLAIYQYARGKEVTFPLLIPFFYFAAQIFLFFVLSCWIWYQMTTGNQ